MASHDTSIDAHLPVHTHLIGGVDFYRYLYTYPTKSSFGSFTDRNAALQSWRGYSGHINLYTHIPFCAQKCGFCNLYTVTLGDRDVKAAAASPPPTLPLTTAAVAAAAGVTGVTTGGAAAAASGAPVWSFNSSSPTDVSRYAAAIIKVCSVSTLARAMSSYHHHYCA